MRCALARRRDSDPMHSTPLRLVWLAATVGLAGYLAFTLASPGADRRFFQPGPLTDGHHQIEIACESCHTPLGGVRQEACLDCHAAELEAALDSHAASIFDDPRNAADLDRIDVRACITCHTEHRPDITAPMGVTLPADFCAPCHETVADDRPTHRGLSIDTCASGGCHNYHDNRALYEDFLVEHGDGGPDTFEGALPPREAWVSWDAAERAPLTAADAETPASAFGDGGPDTFAGAPLTAADADAPASARGDRALIEAWAGSAHAAAGVGCADCHRPGGAAWTDAPALPACAACHELEPEGFLAGRHGMRLAAGLEPMSPAHARLPMRPDARSLTLGCGTCHDAHAVDVRRAAVDGCVACHDDEHTRAYADSPHARLWAQELAGEAPPGSGVSCASCHLPREPRRVAGGERIVVEHNQNANLRPNEKMIRDVCLRCHSLRLSIDALADAALIRRNFAGRPAAHVESIDMARSRRE